MIKVEEIIYISVFLLILTIKNRLKFELVNGMRRNNRTQATHFYRFYVL